MKVKVQVVWFGHTPKIFLNIDYIALLGETAFKTDFGPRKYPNQKVKVQVFWFGHFLWPGPKSFWKSVSLKCAI